MTINRRDLFRMLGAGAALSMLPRSLWAAAAKDAPSDYFILIHASGGWDVTLWADPRMEKRGLVDPAATDNTEIAPLTHWKSATLEGEVSTFEPLTASDSKLVMGPGIGDLWDLRSRLTVINGLAMNTVSHPDGTSFCATGRHLSGGHSPASSIDVALANELGAEQLLPAVAVQFPSSFIGDRLDRRAVPLRVSSAATVAKSLSRNGSYLDASDRTAISSLLADEAKTMSARVTFPETYARVESQEDAQPRLLGDELSQAFTQKALTAAHPKFDYKARFQAGGALSAAFAVEAIKRDLVRTVGFSLGGLDTHNQNYKQHAHTQQELFGVIATLMGELDATPHPHKASSKLADHTHILVFSDFCRTPQINLSGGRDHYPNNSALIISPKFRGGRTFGATDVDQVLPADVKGLGRPLSPPDILATFLHAFAIDPKRYLRDGDVIPEMLV